MNITKIIQARANRESRLQRPFLNFFEQAQLSTGAGELILENHVDQKIIILVERSVVISMVTAIEVYFRDILNFIFQNCNTDFFLPHLKHIHPEKYEIKELIDFYNHKFHPLELISASQSFQNADQIDRVFSKFLPQGKFWNNILKTKARLKDQPENEVTFDHEMLMALIRTFNLRHELVHDPARRSFFNEEIQNDLYATTSIIFGADILLSQIIEKNGDSSLAKE